ncbi:MAG TPA: nuclear transport factor 2 family protein [Candidatus Acidoferrum sp.]|nr:nuclear transport factor 2 family protein [Candidatus Acidoferrum sp.]
MNKREFLLAGGTLALAASTGTRAAGSNRISREEYNVYLERFNSNDMTFIDFYHPNVVFELGATQIVGNTAIRDFYANVKKHIKETVEVAEFISDEGGIAVEIPTRFECIADWPDSFWNVPLKKGQVMRIVSFGFYKVVDRKFAHIKSARYKMIHDWQMGDPQKKA